MDATLDTELRTVLQFTRRLPKLRGAGTLGNLFRDFYLRKKRSDVIADVLDFKMQLNPAEMVDSALLLFPQVYDHREIAYMRGALAPGDVFLDVGANIGFYSLVASRCVGTTGRVIAIEADPYSHQRLTNNVRLNAMANVTALNVGVSDCEETLRLGVNADGNRGESSFLLQSDTGVDVACKSLLSLLKAEGIHQIRGAKFDIEGFEFRVLRQFLEDAPTALYPHFIIIEHNPLWREASGGDALSLLSACGYTPYHGSKLNYIMVREESRPDMLVRDQGR